MKYRHELKFEISQADKMELSLRLRQVMRPDGHAENGKYEIRSLYFDTLEDKALMEKIDGVNGREKYRLRMYNHNPDFIKLEVKRKINGLTQKESEPISKAGAQRLIEGDTDRMTESESALVRGMHGKIRAGLLRPKTIVEYTREAFCHEAGNARVTLDYDLRTGLDGIDFLNPDAVTAPVWTGRVLLEVKWDEFLADFIRDAVHLEGRGAGAFSKYAQARIFG